MALRLLSDGNGKYAIAGALLCAITNGDTALHISGHSLGTGSDGDCPNEISRPCLGIISYSNRIATGDSAELCPRANCHGAHDILGLLLAAQPMATENWQLLASRCA